MTPEKKNPNINVEAMPHSGNLEGGLQELPKRHYDKTDLHEVAGQHFENLENSATPNDLFSEVPLDTGEQAIVNDRLATRALTAGDTEAPKGSETVTGDAEKKKSRGKLIAVLGGTAAAAVAAVSLFLLPKGDNTNNNQPTPTQPVATGEATHGQPQETLNPVDLTKEQKDVVESGLFEGLSVEKKAEIKSLHGMTVEQFRKQPLEKQLMFAQFVYDNNAPRTLKAMKENGFDLEEYANRIVEPSETNTAQQVVDSAAIVIDVAGNLYNDKNEYDVDTARKMLILGTDTSAAAFDGYDKDLQTRATGLAITTTTEISASKLYKADDKTQMKVNLSKADKQGQTTYQLTHFKDTMGKDRSAWRWELSVNTSDPRYDNTVK